MTDRYVPFVRAFTGSPVARAYVLDRETGTMVAGCKHRHRTVRHRDYDESGQRRITSATALAERCAKQLLRSFLASRSTPTGQRAGGAE